MKAIISFTAHPNILCNACFSIQEKFHESIQHKYKKDIVETLTMLTYKDVYLLVNIFKKMQFALCQESTIHQNTLL